MTSVIAKCDRTIRDYSRMSRRVGLIRAALPMLARLNLYRNVYKLQIEVTTHCNLRCVMCEHTRWDEKPATMELEDLKTIIDSLPALIHVDITGIGETLLYRHFVRAIGYLKSRNIFVAFTSNLSLPLNQDLTEAILHNANVVKVSIDGGSKQTYEDIRRGANWDLVIRNLQALTQAKEKAKRGPPIIQIVYTILENNYQQITKAASLFSSIGADAVCFQIPQLPDLSWHRQNKHLIYAAVDQAIKESSGKRFQINFSKYELDKPSISICPNAYSNFFITVNGDVFPCCFIHHAGSRSTYMTHKFGNILELKDKIISTPKRQTFIDAFRSHNVPPLCLRCPVYAFNGDNQR